MTSYLSLVAKYLSAHKKKTRLVVISVSISVALITGIFSMLDVFLQYEKMQVIHDHGNYHIGLMGVTDEQEETIRGRIDVKHSGVWTFFKDGSLNGKVCRIDAIEKSIAPNLNISLVEGKFPAAENEMMLEEWAAENLGLNLGDRVQVAFGDKTDKSFLLSGIIKDYPNTKAKNKPVALISISGAKAVNTEKEDRFYIEFKNGVNVNEAQKAIQSTLGLADNQIVRNEYLLAAMGQSSTDKASGLYITGGILFCIVLIAGVMMIYNTFNISVMERIQQFGLLRCIGASQSQIKKLVRREGLQITLRALPIGLGAGVLITFLCTALLKFYNKSLFGEIPLFQFSPGGVAAGIFVGFLTVYIASLMPAKKAAKVSPVLAVTGSNDLKVSKKKKQGLLTKLFHVETAMGINNAVVKKKTLFLMSCSIAISIVMFLGFQVFIDFLNTSMKTSKPYTADVTLTSEQGMDSSLFNALRKVDGTKAVYGRMFSYVNATFDASRLTDSYKESMGGIPTKDNGQFDAPEKSWLISYDHNQLHWANTDLLKGELSEEKLNEHNGVIAVARNLRNNIATETTSFQLGDKVTIETPNGTKEMTVMGILRTVPFNDSVLSMTNFITTEQLFKDLTGEESYKAIDIQLRKSGQEEAFNEIKSLVSSSITVYDARQQNAEVNQTFFTMAVFLYGFVLVIALISMLNIINTMNTSVASKTRYLGVMRAIGMSGGQLGRMVLMEAATYSMTGCLIGCIAGIALQKALIAFSLSSYDILWKFPGTQIGLIFLVILLITAISVIKSLKRIKSQSVSEIISSL
ncbi:ABC transporter permease [Paenibacillus sp. 22594]|uniref:ABC transporter permease n=1 Tax=Paenibacillus sp. 22594 TaxID=3453947 RepID=UPI003F850691